MAKTLFILNDPPYGTERSYNALRLASSLSRREGEEVKVFLMGDAASCAKANQKVPQGYYNVEIMLRGPARHGAEIGVCGTCMDARGISEGELCEGAKRSTLEQLTDWTVWAEKALVF
ncbi:MAG: DsrE family protein [Polyangiaceae bacterium]|nr:DsrE family protein [Polyangiaceae bacterium]MCL4754736.1 DsrE family protein [Myxococcales bacterium]